MRRKKSFSREYVSEKNKTFHTRVADTYDLSEEQNNPKIIDLYRGIFKDIYKFLINKSKKIEILDIGCGTGFIEHFLNVSKDDVHGIDITGAMIQKAKKSFQQSNLPLEIFTLLMIKKVRFNSR